MNRISISTRGMECDNSSDPAASCSSGSQNDNPASTPESSTNQRPVENERRSAPRNNQRNRSHTTNAPTTPNAPTTAPNAPSDDQEFQDRLQELRSILPDSSDADLRQMLDESDRASSNTRRSEEDARQAAALTRSSTVPSSSGSVSPSRGSITSIGSRGDRRRSWVTCTPAPSRPGIFRVGGPVETGVSFNVGVTDPLELEIKRIEAVSQVQDALNAKLGYNLRESGQYEEMEREFKEGERTLASTGLERRKKKVLPTMKMWDAPPVSKESLMKKEPPLPEAGEPLPLPLSFGGHDEGMQDGGNGEIRLGKFVDVAPDEDEDEEKREETFDSESWEGVSVDVSPMGPYEQVVRCWKCRAGLKVHIEVGLVACPRCRTISPATDIANIG